MSNAAEPDPSRGDAYVGPTPAVRRHQLPRRKGGSASTATNSAEPSTPLDHSHVEPTPTVSPHQPRHHNGESGSKPTNSAEPRSPDVGSLHRPPPVIEFRDVGLTYPGPPPVVALAHCDLTVERGEFLTVVGPSGSGKSTFLNVVGLLDSPTAGAYRLDGIDTGGLGDRDRTALRGRRIGFVFQAFHLLPHRSALENVTLALVYTAQPRAERRERARAALVSVGLGHRLAAVPGRLSGGERQRVAVARALVGRPSLLLCDEPTGNLDSASATSVLDLLDELHAAGMTVVVITHDPEVAARGHRSVTVRDGRLTPRAVTA